jgi:cyclophilin family peptidyl-prolyl cis-trans isomerase
MTRIAAVLVALAVLAAGLAVGSTTAATGATGCPKVKRPKPRSETRKRPKKALDAHKTWTATLKTSCGSFTVRLDVKDSPHTTASFVSLARSHYFDNTIFHRVVPGFVIQGGDPTGSGTGGPGYSTVDKPPRTTKYTVGTVAMAKTQTEPAGTSGSQFFVVTGDASFLTPDYALLGRVTKGMAVVQKIGKLGQRTEAGTPTRIVVIRSVTIASR